MKTRGAKHVGRFRSAGGSGLATNGGLREGFYKALQSQVVVPYLGETLVLLVKRNQMHVVVADDIAAPLLDAHVVIAPVLCEAPDYVKWSLDAWPMRSIYAGLAFALLNIVRDSSHADIRLAGGDYGTVIEEGAIARRVRGQL
jgi:hypothetical protein